MPLRPNKQWSTLDQQTVDKLKGELGVYQLANQDKEVVYVGFAGSQSLFGLRGELQQQVEKAAFFRTEITSAYRTRYQELLMVHYADFGSYPILNSDSDTAKLGRLSPS